jgi:integrase
MRRSELVNLNIEDIKEQKEGLIVYLQKSKTDQESEGRYIGIPFGQNPSTCPVLAYRKWIELSRITEGALFRGVNRHRQVRSTRMNAESINTILKKHIKATGLKEEDFGAHSLRAGYVTTAREMNVPDHIIQGQTGHTSIVMLDRYTHNKPLNNFNSPKLGL